MSVRSVPVTPESCQLQHLQHVLRVGVKLAVANTRSNRPVRVSTDFALVPQTSMGHRPLELSRSAETSLVTAISTQRPLVLRSGMSTTDAAALFEDWELRVSQDTTLYQMAGGKGQHTLETMWAAPLRLEHDLLDTETINPVVAWLQDAQPEGSVARRAWNLQRHLVRIAESAGRRILRRPAFATGLVQAGGGPAHFDEYNNIALLLCGRKRFFIAPYAAMAWKDGEQNGEPNERRDVHPLLPGAHPQPSLRQWLYVDLGPGDILFLPHSWWHYVDSEPHSVMTNLWVD